MDHRSTKQSFIKIDWELRPWEKSDRLTDRQTDRQTDASDFIICPMPCYSTSVIVHIVSRSTFEHWSELTSSLVCDLCLWHGPISCDTRLHGSRPTNKLQSFAALFTLYIMPNYCSTYGLPYRPVIPVFFIPAFSTSCSFVPYFPVLHFYVSHFQRPHNKYFHLSHTVLRSWIFT